MLLPALEKDSTSLSNDTALRQGGECVGRHPNRSHRQAPVRPPHFRAEIDYTRVLGSIRHLVVDDNHVNQTRPSGPRQGFY